MVRELLVAVLGLSAVSATAGECGVHHTDLIKSFAGHWQADRDSSYDIAPGKVNRRSGAKTYKSHFALELDGDAPDTSTLDCRKLTATERDEIGKDMSNLGSVISSSGKAADIELFNKSLAHPPYPMLAFAHYDDSQWMILMDKTHVLDVWFGEGKFSVRVYSKR